MTDDPLAVLHDAARALRSERRELEDERKAFSGFRARVGALETTPSTARPPTLLVDRSPRAPDGIREAYARTVMSVPPFREVYGESYRESLAPEITLELATAITAANRLSPGLRRSLADCVDRAIDARRSLIAFVEDELTAITDAEERLEAALEELESITDQSLDRAGFHVLASSRGRLDALEDRCELLAEERQARIRREHSVSAVGVDDTAQYLYGSCETNHPVLAAIASVCADIEADRRTIDRRLTGLAPRSSIVLTAGHLTAGGSRALRERSCGGWSGGGRRSRFPRRRRTHRADRSGARSPAALPPPPPPNHRLSSDPNARQCAVPSRYRSTHGRKHVSRSLQWFSRSVWRGM